MIIESKKGVINRPIDEVFDFLSDMNNFERLLPEDKISDWKSDEKQCSFKVQGTTTISFIIESTDRPTLIHIVSGANSPFNFTLDIHLKEDEGKTIGYQIFDANINMFMKMMVEGPLTHLIGVMVDRLEEALN
jgi:carbon monoxide dehydrogenase subunit G